MKMNDVLIFVSGAALGSFITWKVIKKKYEQRAQEEIDSVKEVYYRAAQEAINILDEADEAQQLYEQGISEEKPDIDAYKKQLEELQYGNLQTNDSEKPYVISPDDFGEFDEYRTVSLIYYSDAVLADELDEPIKDVDYVVGIDSLDHFGEYEDDYVYVRNDVLKCDYEIYLCEDKFSDLHK